MLGYTTIGTNDFERAIEFFDALLEPLGAKKTLGREGLYLWGAGEGAMLGVCKPHDEKEATEHRQWRDACAECWKQRESRPNI